MDRGTMSLNGRAVTTGEVMRVLGFIDPEQ
jgi:hypothetical protein